ncbi:MAG TPA: phospholipase [Acetobacteraceae bacterium]|nr:phospholipase [Acetobacteraceae bacterium]
MALELEAERLAPLSGAAPDALVVLVHGYGADGRDLLDLAPVWARAVPGAAFVAPHAPHACADSPMGRQWFPLWDRSEGQLVAGLREASADLGAFVAGECGRAGIPEGRVALMGFSQGAMLVLHAGLRGAVPSPAAILAYSGALLGVATPEDLHSHPPVLIAHGMQDEVVPVQAGMAAAGRLRGFGVPVETCLRDGLGHGLDEDGILAGARLLTRVLAAPAPG